MIGPPIPFPPPASSDLIQSIKSIEVTNSDEGRDGFEIEFAIGRSGPTDLIGYNILRNPQIRENNRVIMTAFFGVIPKVLVDGIITMVQVSTSSDPGQSTLKVTGEDLSRLMDTEEREAARPNMPDPAIFASVISEYAQYGIVPSPSVPPILEVPIMVDRIPMQRSTDYEYLKWLAHQNGFVFYLEPGPAPGVSTAYWGPPKTLDIPQTALTVNMGSETNVQGTINFQVNSLKPTLVEGSVQDRISQQTVPIRTVGSTEPPLSLMPSWIVNYDKIRKERYTPDGGMSVMQALAQAQGRTNRSTHVISGTGELDSLRYGDILQARRSVELRGMGLQYSGLYYVKKVTHKIKKGEYKQSFVITRDGEGTTIPSVRPS